ncbi:glutathione S-transferase family protein [Novosphingobium profundi]|uniref:glutathione S-transferase family protein n=1 Tax=Novosphingobium profundi TaxID=1774954 RepID=UPI001BDB4279|nr:glutathione S-transferase family protein [Novosphingobium profundi]MBT0669167.1 glutathione S-transferase family protein [Novosphingobium profundi]
MIELYHYVPVANGGKVLMALHEKEIPFRSHWIDLHAFEQHSPEYLEINPEGQVPALVHEGHVITQTSVINEYLEDAFPHSPPLRPSAPLEAARMRQWNKYIDDVVMEAVSVHGWHTGAGQIARGYSDEEFDILMARVPLEKQRIKWRQARAGFAQEKLDDCTAKVAEAVARVEQALEQGPWLLGEFFSFADINFYAYCGGGLARMFPQIGSSATCPRVLEWVERMEARPGVAKALATSAP